MSMLLKGEALFGVFLVGCLLAEPSWAVGECKSDQIGEKCGNDTWLRRYLCIGDELECSDCDIGEYWDRAAKKCEKCGGSRTSCHRNVHEFACSEKHCDGVIMSTVVQVSVPVADPENGDSIKHQSGGNGTTDHFTTEGVPNTSPTPPSSLSHDSQDQSSAATGDEQTSNVGTNNSPDHQDQSTAKDGNGQKTIEENDNENGEKDDKNTYWDGVKIALAVGIPATLVLVAILAFVFYCKRRPKQKESHELDRSGDPLMIVYNA